MIKLETSVNSPANPRGVQIRRNSTPINEIQEYKNGKW